MQSASGQEEEEQLCSAIPSTSALLLKKKKKKSKTTGPSARAGGAEPEQSQSWSLEPAQELDGQHLRLFGSGRTRNPRRNSSLGALRFPLLSASGGSKRVGRRERGGSPKVFDQKQSVSPAALNAIQCLQALNCNFLFSPCPHKTPQFV